MLSKVVARRLSVQEILPIGIWALLVVISVILIGGCTEEEKEVRQHFEFPELMATWAGPCSDEPVFDAVSARKFYEFGGNDVSQVREFYADGDCKTPAIRLSYEGELTLKGDSNTVEDSQRIRIQWRRAFLESVSAKGTKLLEAVDACGQENWKIKERHDVTAQAGDINCPIGGLPEASENIVKVDGNFLYFGKEWLKGKNINRTVDSLDESTGFEKIERAIK